MREPAPRKPKRLVFCFDGTWNQLSADRPTNVVQLAQMVEPTATDGTPQIVHYDEGIGTNMNRLLSFRDGAFGQGMLRIIREAYRFLIFNYRPGDQIYAFGFSRGAYTARSFVGFIRHAGILDVDNANVIDRAIRIYRTAKAGEGIETEEGLKFRSQYCRGVCVSAADRDYRIANLAGFDPAKAPILTIRYLGVWDTVRALGVPDFIPGATWFNRKYGFHNAVLTSKIKAARHAVAIDELRPTFRASLFGREKVAELNARTRRAAGPPMPEWLLPYQEKWFPGVHGAVGGGGSLHGLSDGALEWVLQGARRAGLELRGQIDHPGFRLRPDPFEPVFNEPKVPLLRRGPIGWLRSLPGPRQGPTSLAELALAALRRWHADPAILPGRKPYRPGALAGLAREIDSWPYRSPPEWKGAEAVGLEDYTIIQGDTLSKLAKSRLGESKRWHELFELNRDRIDDPDALAIGLEIRLPVASPPP
jgi:uncharacterized protein (DUF2235 family)